MRLKNKVALITGGTSGIGEATALLFAGEGARVGITGRNSERGAGVVARIKASGGDAVFFRADVSLAEDCRRAVDETLRAFGSLDILFNNAGVFYPQTAIECSEKEWDEQIDVNLKGTFLMSKFALPTMIARGSGVIINNSSGWGLVGGDHAVAYCASKGGVVLMTKAMAIDHGPPGHSRELHLSGRRGDSDASGGCENARLEVGGLHRGMRQPSAGTRGNCGGDCQGSALSRVG